MSESPSSSRMIRLALVQMACSDNRAENIAHAVQAIRTSAAQGAHIICLQELFADLYPCQSEDHARFATAEPIPGPTTEILAAAARENNVVVIGSIFEQRAAGIYHNTAIVLDSDGTLVGQYRKMHIPDDPLYYEKFYFTPGDRGFTTFDTDRARIGVCICWDQWFPEAARLTALSGAEILFYPTAIGWLHEEKDAFGASQRSAWQTMLKSHAIANGVYVAAPNRVGSEGGLEFWGSSFVCDPYGEVIASAADAGAEIVFADCDLDLIDIARTHWPFLRDRRIDAYDGLTQRWLGDA